MRFLFPAAIAAALAANAAQAVTTIDFEGVGDNVLISGANIGVPGVTVSAFASNALGVADDPLMTFDPIGFDTNRNVTPELDPDLLWPYDNAFPNPGIIAVLRERNGTDGDVDTSTGPANDRRNDLPGTMRFVFDEEIEFVSLDAIDFGDTAGNPNIRIFLDSIEIFGADASSDGVSGDSRAETFVARDVVRGNTLDIVFRSSGGIDNIKVNVVPLPAGAWLLLSGFGLVAGARRLRRPAA